jgi:hypothetical protein
MRLSLLLCWLLFFGVPVSAEQTQPIPTSGPTPLVPMLGPSDLLTAPVRDAEALNVVQKALTAMGGPAIAAIQDCTIQAQSDASADPQAISGTMTWKMAAIT